MPVFFPIVQTLGYDPIWFGVVLVLLALLMTFPDLGALHPTHDEVTAQT